MARFQRLACPSCGGALDIPTAHEQFFKCGTCGAALEDTEYERPDAPVTVSIAHAFTGFDELALQEYATRVGRTASKAGKVIAGITSVAVLGAVGAGAYGVYRAVDSAVDTANAVNQAIGGATGDGFGDYGFSVSSLVAGGESSTSSVLAVTHGPNRKQLHSIELGAVEPLQWTTSLTDVIPADASLASYERLIATGERVFLTWEEHLLAFDRATGAFVYQRDLPDIVVSYCVDCLRGFGDGVGVLTADGTLQMLDAATGAPRWRVTLAGNVPRQLLDVNGEPAVITQAPDGTTGVVMYSAADGTIVHSQSPQCVESGSSIHAYDRLEAMPDGGYLWLGGSSGGCAQRWSPGAEAPDWTVTLPNDPMVGRDVFTDRPVLVSDDVAVAITNRGVVELSLADGSSRSVTHTQDVRELTPVALVGHTVVLTEKYTRGSGRWQLTGLDLTDPSGATGWQAALEGEPGDDGFITGEEWLVGPTLGGIGVVEFDVDANTIRTRVVDPATGTSGVPATLVNDDLTFTEYVGWRGAYAILGFDDHVIALDPATAAVAHSAP